MKIMKSDMKLHRVAKITNLIYQEVVYFLKLHLYWLENVMNFMGPGQKITLSIVSMLQPKALHFHCFILKVPCFLQFFGQPWTTTILLQDQLHHLFYRDCVKKTVFMISQLTFIQDSQMLLLSKVQTMVTQFLDINWCVQLLQSIATCDNTGNEWIHQTLQPVVWIYSARIIRIFFIPLTAVIWFKKYAHLKSIFNGISSSHLTVTWEKFLVQNQFMNG